MHFANQHNLHLLRLGSGKMFSLNFKELTKFVPIMKEKLPGVQSAKRICIYLLLLLLPHDDDKRQIQIKTALKRYFLAAVAQLIKETLCEPNHKAAKEAQENEKKE